jgi:hypothetical protein
MAQLVRVDDGADRLDGAIADLEHPRGEHRAVAIAHERARLAIDASQVEMQADVAELRRAVADLGATVAGLNRPVPRQREVRRRRGWSSAP